MKIYETVMQLAPQMIPGYRAAFAGGRAMFEVANITTPYRAAHFVAQVLHESNLGRADFENLVYSASRIMAVFGTGRHSAAVRPAEADDLAGRPGALAERVYGLGNPYKARELGNIVAGDAYRYRGGGLLQITGRGAYLRLSQKTGVDFLKSPHLVVSGDYALAAPLGVWRERDLNQFADKNDINSITRAVNGGYNGIDARRNLFTAAFKMLGDDNTPAANPDSLTATLQRNLNTLGVTPPLEVDGLYGPATTSAVRAFQHICGLQPDGVAGPVTRAMIQARLDKIRE